MKILELVPSSTGGIIAMMMAIAPALVLVVYYYRKDKMRPEPKGLIIKIFLLGLVSTIPVAIMERLGVRLGSAVGLHGLGMAFYISFVLAGFIEEYAKLQIVRRFAFNHSAFDEITDGIVYTVVASLGFACLENILYVSGGGMTTALARAFTAVPMHAFMSGIMGYYIGKARFAASEVEERRLMRKGLIIAVLLHGTYDVLLFAAPLVGQALMLGIFPLIFGSFIVLRKKLEAAQAEDRAIKNSIDDLDMARGARHRRP
jgi:protease PrsW